MQELRPTADAHVSRSRRSSNYGRARTLRVDQSPLNRAYLRFQLSGIDVEQVEKAELRVYVMESSNRGFDVRAVDDDTWKENSIRYSNAPKSGDVIARWRERTSSGKWITMDITSYVVSQGGDNDDNEAVSIVLTGGSSNGFDVASKERGESRAPRLVITFK